MNPEVFLQNFSDLAEAPGGVDKLRELVLQLAVMGKLVPQDPMDESADELLGRVAREKRKLSQQGLIRSSGKARPVEAEEIPYRLPKNWAWSRLGDIGLINPRNTVEDDLPVAFVPMALVPDAWGGEVKCESRAWSEVKSGFTHLAENDVVLAKITPCFQNRKSAVMRNLLAGVGAGTTELHVFRPVAGTLLPNYALAYLKSPRFIEGGASRMTGTAGQKRVPKDYFSGHPLPLPPLAEQERIVAKVDQLMALCDELEERQQKRNEVRSALNTSCLRHLTTAESSEALTRHWYRTRDNFELLYDTPETVPELRQSLLQLAFQGRITSWVRTDQSADELVKEIGERKAELLKAGKVQKDKLRSSVVESNPPWRVPIHWCWVRLQDVCEVSRGGSPRPAGDTRFFGGDIPWITVRELTKDDRKHLESTSSGLTVAGSKRSRFVECVFRSIVITDSTRT